MSNIHHLNMDEKDTLNQKLKRQYKFIELQFISLLALLILILIPWDRTYNWLNVILAITILFALIGINKNSGLRGLVQLNKSMKQLNLNSYQLLVGNCYNKEQRQEHKIRTLYIVRVIGEDDCTYEVIVNKEVYSKLNNGDVIKFIKLDTQLCIYLDVLNE